MEFQESAHPDQETLRRFASDELDDDLAKPVSTHVENCHNCQAELHRLGGLQSGDSTVATADTGNRIQRQQHSSQFRIGQQIAEGGMGVVYQGFDNELGRDVAIKVMPRKSEAKRKVAAIRFEREARLSGQLQHPGVVPIHKLGRLADGRPFIAMKLVEGKTLSSLIAGTEPANRGRLLDVFGQVCQTIAYTHSQHVIHRDLKPQNVMVGPFGEVQVMDWGLAKKLPPASQKQNTSEVEHEAEREGWLQQTQDNLPSDQTASGAVLGTPAYMPPEQAKADSSDTRSDVFSLGGILCEILTGQPPYVADGIVATHELAQSAKMEAAFQRLEDSGGELELIQLAKDCLAPDSEERPFDAQVVSQRFSEIINRRDQRLKEVELDRAQAQVQLRVENKRRKQIAALSLAIAAVMLCTMFATYSYWSEKSARRADQFEQERSAAVETKQRESSIREVLKTARALGNRALVAADSDQTTQWADVLAELNKANGLLAEDPNSQLGQQFESYRQQAAAAFRFAESTSQTRRKERHAKQAIRMAVMNSWVPDKKFVIRANFKTLEQFENGFANFGIRMLDDPQSVTRLIQKSGIKDELILGMHEWHNQFVWLYPAGKRDDERQWLSTLLDKVDANPFRTELRQQIRNRDFAALVELMKQPDAIETTLATAIVYRAMQRPSAKERRQVGLKKWNSAKINFLRRAHVKFPDDFVVNFEIGNYYRINKAPELSLPFWYCCLALEPSHVGAMRNLTQSLHDAGQVEKAMDCAKYYWELYPNYPSLLNALTVFCSTSEQNEKGLQYARLCTEKFPDYRDGHFNRHILARRVGLYPEAIESAKRVLEMDPESPLSSAYVAKLYFESEQYEEALPFALKFYEKAPRSEEAMLRLIKIHTKLSSLQEAVKICEVLVQRYPKAKHQLEYARVLLATSSLEKADDVLQELSPVNAHQKMVRAMLQIQSLERQGKLERAAKVAQAFFDENPKAVFQSQMSQELKQRLSELKTEKNLK